MPPSSAAEPRPPAEAQSAADDRVEQLKKEVLDDVDARRVFIQRMVDTQFSFSELGFQEFETQRYITGAPRRGRDSRSSSGTAGIPSGWIARWGSGRPVIALGSDVDGIPQSSQVPGVAWREPLDRRTRRDTAKATTRARR